VSDVKRKRVSLRAGFHVALTNRRAQAATMVLAPGGAEGGAGNRHRGADQWLYVLEGSGAATINGRRVGLAPGELLLIERGDRHLIRNTGRRLLKTLNVYVPPAYTPEGEEREEGRP
jgi:mannose-6-phosphate isomerase-like protein (cupin superfamily)